MAVTSTPFDRFKEIIYRDTVVTDAGSNDIYGGPCTLYYVRINNASGQVAHVKLYDADTGGSPSIILTVAIGATRDITIPAGVRFDTALSIRVTDAKLSLSSGDGDTPSGSAVEMYFIAKELV